MNFKRCITTVAAVVIAVNTMALSAKAVSNEDRETIKGKLFEYLWNSEGWSNWDDDGNYTAVEDNPAAAYWYSLIEEFIGQCNDETFRYFDMDNISHRDIKDLFSEFADWYYDSEYNEWENEYENGEYRIYVNSGGYYLNYGSINNSWTVIDDAGKIVKEMDRLDDFSYLNEAPENNYSNYEEYESSEDDSSEYRKAASARVTGIPTDEPVRAYPATERENALNSRAAETTGSVRLAGEIDDEEDEEDTDTGVLPIIGSAVAGIAIGAIIVTLINKRSSKKKK